MNTTGNTQIDGEKVGGRRTHVVVLGAGYAGAMAANRLRRNPAVDVTVVSPQPFFLQRIRLHQFVAGTGDPQVGFDDVLADDIRVVVDTATRIDNAGCRVHLASGGYLDYDYLIYAIGTRHRNPQIPGAAEPEQRYCVTGTCQTRTSATSCSTAPSRVCRCTASPTKR